MAFYHWKKCQYLEPYRRQNYKTTTDIFKVLSQHYFWSSWKHHGLWFLSCLVSLCFTSPCGLCFILLSFVFWFSSLCFLASSHFYLQSASLVTTYTSFPIINHPGTATFHSPSILFKPCFNHHSNSRSLFRPPARCLDFPLVLPCVL